MSSESNTESLRTDGVKSAPRGFLPVLLALGPGLVLTGGVVGSGELINTPIQAAKFGFLLLWAVVVSCVIKYFLQVEFGRHCLVHNRSVFEALNEMPGPKLARASWLIWIFVLAWTLAQVGSAGIVGAIAGLIQRLMPSSILESVESISSTDETQTARVLAFFVVGIAMLVLWKGAYQRIEKVIVTLVVGFSVCVVIALALLQRTGYRITAPDLASGLTFSLGDMPQEAAYAVIALMGALGVSGVELVVYPYWIREKGYAKFLGSPDSRGWRDRALGWARLLKIDAAVATIMATVITSAYFLLGAAVLFRQGKTPEGIGVVDQISAIFTDTYGEWSRGLFVVGAFCTLFSTLLAATAANSRIYTDFLATIGVIDRANEAAVRRSHWVVQTLFLLGVLSLFLLMPERPDKLVLLSHYVIGIFGTPLAIVAICWLAFKTDSRVRMGRLGATLLLVTAGGLLLCLAVGFAFERGWIR